jgi:hypothetical protein
MADPNDSTGPDADGIVWRHLTTKAGKDFLVGWKVSDPQEAQPLPQVKKEKDEHSDPGLAKATIAHRDSTATAEAVTEAKFQEPDVKLDLDPWIPVKWEVGDHKWRTTDDAVADLGIKRYKLHKNSEPNIWDYTLKFTNTKGWRFWFADEEKDVYQVDTILNRNHWLKYNSGKPTIVFVTQGGLSKLTLLPK